MKISGVWPSKLQLTNYDLQKIEFLVSVDKNIEVSWKLVKKIEKIAEIQRKLSS